MLTPDLHLFHLSSISKPPISPPSLLQLHVAAWPSSLSLSFSDLPSQPILPSHCVILVLISIDILWDHTNQGRRKSKVTRKAGIELRIFTLPRLFHTQSCTSICTSVVDYLLWPFLPLLPFPEGIKQVPVKHPSFLICVDTLILSV